MRDVNYEKLTKRAIAIYTRERIALVDGDADALRDCTAQKAELLEQLDAIIIARRTSENGQLMRANKPMSGSIWPKT